MKRKGEGSCLLKQGKPRLELPRWSISISEWSCSCTATATLQGGTSEERTLWMCSEAGETLIFQPVWKSGDKLMFEKPTKIKGGGEKGKGVEKSLRFWRGQNFTSFLKLRYSIIHLMLQAAVRYYGGIQQISPFFSPSFINKSVSQPWIQSVQMQYLGIFLLKKKKRKLLLIWILRN